MTKMTIAKAKLVIVELVDELRRAGVSLTNDARYWDLCRTYGDSSPEVLGHLRSCVAYQREHDNYVDHVRNREHTP